MGSSYALPFKLMQQNQSTKSINNVVSHQEEQIKNVTFNKFRNSAFLSDAHTTIATFGFGMKKTCNVEQWG